MNQILYAGKHSLTTAVSRHNHSSWELIFCTSGSGELVFDDRTIPYAEGDVAIVPPFLPHSNRSAEGFTNIFLNIEDAVLTGSEPVIVKADPYGFLLNAFHAAYYFYSSTAEGHERLLSSYGQLIATFLSAGQPTQHRSRIVQEIEDNILHNFADCDYDLNAYLHSLPFNTEYLKKLFKKELGTTPLQYLTDKRLENAARILVLFYDSRNISEAARQCGFSDPLYFSRVFKKKYGVSPRNYKPEATVPITDGDSMKNML